MIFKYLFFIYNFSEEFFQDELTLLQINLSMGIKLILKENINSTFTLKQYDLLNMEIGNFSFKYIPNDRDFIKYNRIQKINSLKMNFIGKLIDHQYIFCVETVKNKKNEITKLLRYKSCNLYNLLNDIFDFKNRAIYHVYQPDYYSLFNKIEVSEDEKLVFYNCYYRLNGFDKKYIKNLVYINDCKATSMTEVLNIFGIPGLNFNSGNGKNIFLYFGMHVCDKCENNKKKYYYGLMIFCFNFYGKLEKFFYRIDFCSFCHKNINEPNIFLQVENSK